MLHKLVAPNNTAEDPSEDFPLHPLEDSDIWLSENLVVRITKPDWEFDKQKSLVTRVSQDSCHQRIHATVKLRSGQKLKVDQQYLETVIPKPGKWARIVLGIYRGFEGRIISVDADTEEASVSLFLGPFWGDMPEDLPRDTSIVSVSRQAAYETRVKRKVIDRDVLERGELVVHHMPFDAVCRVSPPDEFAEMDSPFHHNEEAAEQSGR
eukprot:Gregarina_sp_Poly_1__4565@NODE_244_length_10763_cov_79_258975_g214_i0_p6_GENE_NODE_244_length_10763_cov_79_258975_g214_i0NODE_244_length_10763_cov_79_258975_g214_i0_p6_ORF_typecomplete_len209_score35_23KN17_SH3/PF18131_1/0_00061_NODE_244_length_10763_cov_79_258975_g214_i037974423